MENTINEKTGRGMQIFILIVLYYYIVNQIPIIVIFHYVAPTDLEDKTLDELDELEDEEDEKILLEYRRKRIAELQELANKSKYGNVKEISGIDYVQEVNNAGEDVQVVLHLYKTGYDINLFDKNTM